MRISTLMASLAACGLTLVSAAEAASTPPPPEVELRARYALPNSRFVEIDGEPIHYVDEGHGPAIVLIHGSYASLRQWDVWARALKGRYRVIRLDASPAGLSGPNPGGDYGVERRVAVIDRLTRQLGVKRFFVVATSSGGATGMAFAVEHPDRVLGLVLNNIAAGPVAPDPASFPPELRAAIAADGGKGGPEFWRQILLHNMVDKSKVTPDLVREWTELNGRAKSMPPAPGSPPAAAMLTRAPDDLARITAPTLLLWSTEDNETTLDGHGRKALSLLAAKDKALLVVPGCGHMAPLDCPTESLALALPFFGRLSPK